jgi:hypothetical protein
LSRSPLQQVEQRKPRKRRQLGIGVVFDALLEQLARSGRLAAREAQRRILEHGAKPGIRLRDFKRCIGRCPLHEACAGHRDVARIGGQSSGLGDLRGKLTSGRATAGSDRRGGRVALRASVPAEASWLAEVSKRMPS